MAGRSKERPELAATADPARGAHSRRVPCRGGEALLRGCSSRSATSVDRHAARARRAFPEWGESRYFTRRRLPARSGSRAAHAPVRARFPCSTTRSTTGSATTRSRSCCATARAGWPTHPERELIARRYLKHRHSLVREALARLVAEEEPDADDAAPTTRDAEEERARAAAQPQRAATGHGRSACCARAARRRVLDLGCGEGRLLRRLLDERAVHAHRRHGRLLSVARDRRPSGSSSTACRRSSASASSCSTAR